MAYRKSLSIDRRQHYSYQITATVRAYLTTTLEPSASLLIYRAMPTEVATDKLLQLPDYHIFAPITHDHQHMDWRRVTQRTRWSKGLFGVLEPVSGQVWKGSSTTVLLCPLTAFDRQGNRLGMGKGCFDYWLADHRHKLHQVIGLAFSGQEVAQVPVEVHDAPLDCIITEKEVIQCPKA